MLRTEHVTLKFGGLCANNDVSMSIKKGHITGLIGPNGAGKTTFFNCLTGVYKPTEGSIFFENKRIDGKRGFEINKAGLARTYQHINLFWNMSVIENVLVGQHSRLKAGMFSAIFRTKEFRRQEEKALEKAYELLKFVGLEDKAHEVASSLPYGDQRLLEIVRGLASEPQMLLLDEPAAGMNTAEKKELDVLLKRILNSGVSMLLIEHDMQLMMGVADYIFVLNNGKLLAQGTPEEVQNNEDVITAYLGG